MSDTNNRHQRSPRFRRARRSWRSSSPSAWPVQPSRRCPVGSERPGGDSRAGRGSAGPGHRRSRELRGVDRDLPHDAPLTPTTTVSTDHRHSDHHRDPGADPRPVRHRSPHQTWATTAPRGSAPTTSPTFFSEPIGALQGADYQRALRLDDARVLWTFQDAFISGTLVHNVGVLQSGRCFTLLNDGARSWLFADTTVHMHQWHWILDGGQASDGSVHLFVAQMNERGRELPRPHRTDPAATGGARRHDARGGLRRRRTTHRYRPVRMGRDQR